MQINDYVRVSLIYAIFCLFPFVLVPAYVSRQKASSARMDLIFAFPLGFHPRGLMSRLRLDIQPTRILASRKRSIWSIRAEIPFPWACSSDVSRIF